MTIKDLQRMIYRLMRKQSSIIVSAHRGFTIIELLIYMGLLSTILLVLTTLFGNILDVQLESQSQSSVMQDGVFIHARLSYDIQRAASITIPAAIGNTTSSLQLVVDGVTTNYAVDGNANLVISNASGSENLNGFDSRISGLQFQRIGNPVGGQKDTIKIDYTVTSRTQRVGAGAGSSIFNTTVMQR